MFQKLLGVIHRFKVNLSTTPIDDLPDQYMSEVKFKEAVKAIYIELYRDITIIYLVRPGKENGDKLIYTYYFNYKREFHAADSSSEDEIKILAHDEVDRFLD